jgi:xanthine dehydrogenase accessory factor
VGKAVAHLARWLGFRVALSDDRPEFCTPDAIPDAEEFFPLPLEKLPQHLNITTWTSIVMTTRGVEVDLAGLPAILETPAGYIGIIGSKRRWEMTKRKLLEAGISPDKIDRVRSPIGLEINAETPEEIAVSIMAEILMLRLGGDGKPMKG